MMTHEIVHAALEVIAAPKPSRTTRWLPGDLVLWTCYADEAMHAAHLGRVLDPSRLLESIATAMHALDDARKPLN